MAWYTAPAARSFADQFAPDWPRKGSKDGSVGDTAHNARVSDHNPDYNNGGVVRAVDVDIKGRDKAAMTAAAIADKRTRYFISDGRIWQNPLVYPKAGGWHEYSGSDGHYGHVHLSIRHNKIYENDTSRWGAPAPVPEKKVDDMTPELAARLDQIVGWMDANFKSQAAVAERNRNLLADWTRDQTRAAVNASTSAIVSQIPNLDQAVLNQAIADAVDKALDGKSIPVSGKIEVEIPTIPLSENS